MGYAVSFGMETGAAVAAVLAVVAAAATEQLVQRFSVPESQSPFAEAAAVAAALALSLV